MLAKVVVAALLAVALVALLPSVCGCDPDVNKSGAQLITEKGYPLEHHWVVTDDHYVLGLLRIPHGLVGGNDTGALRPAVLLQHGALLCIVFIYVKLFVLFEIAVTCSLHCSTALSGPQSTNAAVLDRSGLTALRPQNCLAIPAFTHRPPRHSRQQ